VLGLPVLVVVMRTIGAEAGLATEVLLALILVLGAAALGGVVPGIVGSLAAVVAINYFLVEPIGTFRIAEPGNVVALVVFVTVSSTVAMLMDRVRRRSHEAARATAEANALARAAAVLAAAPDPLPDLLEQLRRLAGVDSAAVMRRGDDGRWAVEATSGEPVPTSPSDGASYDLSTDGGTVVVFQPSPAAAGDGTVLDAFVDALSVALESRRLQAEAADAAVVAEADALRTGILQAVSHDLRTPLAGIKASVTSLLSTDVTFDADVTEEFLRTIDTEVDRLDRVVGNLLDMGRLQAGALSVLRRPTALEEVVSAALSHLDLSLDQVQVDVPETLPLVDIDGALVERAVANVVANALAVQPEGTAVRVQAGAIQRNDDEWVSLQIVDRGPGLAANQRERVFEPFQRLGDRSTQAGVGLGLAIAQGFTRATGGTLDLDDTPGGGLTVTFELPVART
jgi:two-component system sensor histidine kinase KdpD